MKLLKLTRVIGAVIFLAGCCVWVWAPHVHGVPGQVVPGVLGAIGFVLMLWGKGERA